MPEDNKKLTINRSIERATQILIYLGANIHSIKDIARHCRLSPSTVHRILQTLQRLDWVRQDQTDSRYYLGPLASQLSSNLVSAHRYLVMNSVDEMMNLSKSSGETVSLGIMIHLKYVSLHDIPSKHNLRVFEGSDTSGAPTQGATGKVALSQLSDEDIRHALHSIASWKDNNQPKFDTTAFLDELKAIRKKGYAVSYGEVIPGTICISAPIRNYPCPAVLNIIGPESRLNNRLEQSIKELRASAERISSSNSL
jgi:IclR family transcriptional regulator, acetate operon repressor